MSTRSNIAVKLEDGSIKAVYCHFDGYPEWNGRILLESWTDEAKVKQLVELGNLSALGSEIGEKHDFDKRDGVPESWCRFYGRDRGEKDQDATTYANEAEFQKMVSEDVFIEYAYLFKSGKWYMSTGGKFKLLTKKICKIGVEEMPK